MPQGQLQAHQGPGMATRGAQPQCGHSRGSRCNSRRMWAVHTCDAGAEEEEGRTFWEGRNVGKEGRLEGPVRIVGVLTAIGISAPHKLN
jgi:hypothetical protein